MTKIPITWESNRIILNDPMEIGYPWDSTDEDSMLCSQGGGCSKDLRSSGVAVDEQVSTRKEKLVE